MKDRKSFSRKRFQPYYSSTTSKIPQPKPSPDKTQLHPGESPFSTKLKTLNPWPLVSIYTTRVGNFGIHLFLFLEFLFFTFLFGDRELCAAETN